MSALPNAHALIIGIAHYRHINRLPLAVLKDARDIYALLTEPDVCGYPEGNVTLLLDDQATRAGVHQALAELAKRTNTDSTVFLYISGHGGRITQGSDAGEYLLPVDTRLKPSVYPLEPAPATAISGAEFTAALHALPARKVVVLFDCCHSGGIGEIKAGIEPVFKTGLPESYYDKLVAGRGRVILASSRDTEFSYILPGDDNSLFTKHLKAGLQGGAPNRDGLIHIFELFEYIHPRVTGAHSEQHPVFRVKIEENFPLALYLGGQKTAAPAVETAGEFRYDAYVSFVRAPEDLAWVRGKLLPLLKAADLQNIAMTGQVDEPGIPTIVGVQRAVELSKRTVVVLSRAYLDSSWAELENLTAGFLGVEERQARLLPVVIDESLLDKERHLNRDVPLALRQLWALDVVDDYFGEENLARLPDILKRPIPRIR